jgi:hypothetical protein
MLGVGEIRCCDKRLRQWAVCVTLSATPKTVTHAWKNAAFNAVLCIRVGCKNDCRRDTSAGQRIRKMGVSAAVMSQDHSLSAVAALFGPGAAGVSAKQTGLRRCPRRQGIFVDGENAASAAARQVTFSIAPPSRLLRSSKIC